LRLSDHIAAQCGSEEDIGGIFSMTALAIRHAQRFELSDDVARAAYNLTRMKPSSLLNAMPLCRLPYRRIWLEWRGGITSAIIPRERRRDIAVAPDPLKMGCLIEADASGQRGTMTFAWVHKARPGISGVNISPLGSLFNWEESGIVHKDAMDEITRRYPTKETLKTPLGLLDMILAMRYSSELSDAAAKHWMEKSSFHMWHQFAGVASERRALQTLGNHHMPFVPPHTLGFLKWCAELLFPQGDAGLDNFMKKVVQQSWEMDIEGEPPFCEAVIAMMNSRNAIEHRDVDLTGLNHARAKRGRPLFMPYRTTHLRLSQAQTRAFRAGLLSREDAGRHSVRGHFKIRKTGIYWWSPFLRGDPTKPLKRQEYVVS